MRPDGASGEQAWVVRNCERFDCSDVQLVNIVIDGCQELVKKELELEDKSAGSINKCLGIVGGRGL